MTEHTDQHRASGAEKPAEADDPMMLTATYIPGALDAMSEAAVEEFSQIGMSPERIFQLFESPFFTGTHRYYRLRGEDATRAMIARVLERTPAINYRVEMAERNCYKNEEEIDRV